MYYQAVITALFLFKKKKKKHKLKFCNVDKKKIKLHVIKLYAYVVFKVITMVICITCNGDMKANIK